MLGAWRDRRTSWASRSRRGRPTPSAAVRRRVVRPRARPRRAAPPPRAGQGAGGVPSRAGTGRHARVHGRAVRHGDRLAVVPKRVGGLAEPAWRRAMRPRRKGGRTDPAPPPNSPTARSSGSWTCTRSPRATCARSRADAGFTDVRVCGEELLANVYGWLLRRLESDVEPDDRAARLAQVRVPQLPGAAEPRWRAAGAAPAGETSSTTCWSPAAGRPDPT